MKNRRLLIFYKVWSKLYDLLIDKIFSFDRKSVVAELDVRKGYKVLEVGVGTGLNLHYYPKYCTVVGIDLSKDMLDQAKKKKQQHVTLKQMDAEKMNFKKNTFDRALLTFALRVIPNPKKALKEVERITKPRARIVIYDDFSRKPGFSFWNLFEKIGWGRNYVLNDLIKGIQLRIIKKERNLIVLENGKT